MKYFFVPLLLILFSTAGAAVKLPFSPERPVYAPKDTDTVVRKQLVSVGTSYGSDIQFFGRTGPVRYPYLNANAIYNFKSGLFVYGSVYNIIGYYPIVDEVDLGAGYLFKYSKKSSGSLSFTHFFFTEDAAQVIRSASANDINFRNAIDWKIAQSSATFDYLFGYANDYFITLTTSKYIETDWGIFDDKDYLSFNPTISAIFGTQNFVGRYSSQHLARLYFDPDDIRGLNVPPSFVNYNNGKFNALNYSFKLPIAYNRPHYTFEASWKYSVPIHVEGALRNRPEVFFNLTFFYLFY
jgi:hypothetical protein